jgi:rsbT co-antagonist protein RsbR
MYSTALVELLRTHERALLDAWIGAQRAAGMRVDLLDETTILANSAELLRQITVAAAQGLGDLRESHWQPEPGGPDAFADGDLRLLAQGTPVHPDPERV